MSEQGRPPVFLERRSYRRRRMMDALRFLPVLGVLLWMVPILWPTAADGPTTAEAISMSTAVVYVFAVWCALIVAALARWSFLRLSPEMGEDAGTGQR
jgi:hypothetical protein